MTATAIKDEVRKLPRSEQLSLIQYIVQILQTEDDFTLSDAWKTELDRRDEAFRNGEEKLYSWTEAQKILTSQK